MAFDFPNSPSEGTVYGPPGGPVYVYTGGVWRMQGSAGTATAEARNRIVNGAMQISQEYLNTAVTAGLYAADQWVSSSAGTGVFTVQRVQAVTPNGSQNRLRLVVTTADATIDAADVYCFQQPVEGIRIADFKWGSASARQVVLRFGFKGPAGTYSAALRNSASNRSYPVNFTITAGQAATDTEQVFAIPGDTTGTWTVDTAIGMTLFVPVAVGTIRQGTVNVWNAGNIVGTAANTNGMANVTGGTFELFDVGLYLDPNATGVPPPWQMPDEADELAACQRYYAAHVASVLVSGIATAASQTAYMTYFFPATMRAVPTISFSAPAATNSNNTLNVTSPNVSGCRVNTVSSAAGVFNTGTSTAVLNARM